MGIRRTLLASVFLGLSVVAGCGGGSTGTSTVGTTPPSSTTALNLSLRDMPPAGTNILSFSATVTGAVMQPGNVSVLNAPMTVEMTQLQSMAAYLSTVNVPAGNYTGMTVTFSNPRMTFLNNSGAMMMNFNCPQGQICQITPPMTTAGATISGAPFPLNVVSGTPMSLVMDFDLMDSMQSNMSVSPMMSSFLQQPNAGSGGSGPVFGGMQGMIGVVNAVNAGNQSFTVQFAQGAPILTVMTGGATVFEGFDSIGKPNNFSSLAPGQTVEMAVQLTGAGALQASTVQLESGSGQELYGMIVGVNSTSGWCDVVVMNQAPVFSGVNIGDEIQVNLHAGTQFGMDNWGMDTGGMNFAGFSDMMPGQVVGFAPLSGLTPGTPPQVNVNQMRLMSAWVTGTISQVLSSTDFVLTPASGIFSATGSTSLHIVTSSGTAFDGVTGMSGLSVGNTVSLRGPLFTNGGNPTFFATYVLKR